MPKPAISRDILLAALTGFRLDKQRIDSQIAEVQAMLDGGGSAQKVGSEEVPRRGTRKKFSAATRRKMALAQRARYARSKGNAEQPEPVMPIVTKAKRKMSAAGRKAIGDATRKRWALKKATESAPAKKRALRKAAVKKPTAKATKKVAPVRKVAVKKSARKKTAQATAPAVAQAVA